MFIVRERENILRVYISEQSWSLVDMRARLALKFDLREREREKLSAVSDFKLKSIETFFLFFLNFTR